MILGGSEVLAVRIDQQALISIFDVVLKRMWLGVYTLMILFGP